MESRSVATRRKERLEARSAATRQGERAKQPQMGGVPGLRSRGGSRSEGATKERTKRLGGWGRARNPSEARALEGTRERAAAVGKGSERSDLGVPGAAPSGAR